MVNAIEMAKVFNAEVARFMENKGTQYFIDSCLKTRNSAFLNIEKEEDLYISRQKSGNLTCILKMFTIFAANYIAKGGRTRLYATGFFYALLQTLYGSVPPCRALMRRLPLVGGVQRVRRNRFHFCSLRKTKKSVFKTI